MASPRRRRSYSEGRRDGIAEARAALEPFAQCLNVDGDLGGIDMMMTYIRVEDVRRARLVLAAETETGARS